jgi:hypothetical protein
MRSAQLIHCIVCDDVRIEMGNKLSFMGVFENVFLSSFPSVLLKFAVVNHWEGVGQFETQVKIVTPDRREVVVSAPSTFVIEDQGYADNITFFTNVAFDRAGPYAVQIMIDGRPVAEKRIFVHHVQPPPSSPTPTSIN